MRISDWSSDVFSSDLPSLAWTRLPAASYWTAIKTLPLSSFRLRILTTIPRIASILGFTPAPARRRADTTPCVRDRNACEEQGYRQAFFLQNQIGRAHV